MKNTKTNDNLYESGDNRLVNADLMPIPAARQKWTWFSYMALWMGIIHNIFNYAVAASLIALGMNIWQALLTILVGNFVLIIPLALNGHAGSRYGLSFPVLARVSFGVFGANVPALLRGFVAIAWFGIQSYLGAGALNAILIHLFPVWHEMSASFLGMAANEWISLIIFWLLQGFLVLHGMETIRRFENFAGPIILVLMLGLVYWAFQIMDGIGPIFDQPTKYKTWGSFLPVFFPAVITVVGTFATMALNIPDFTRFSRSSKDQFYGQILGLPVATLLFSVMAAITTSATVVAFGHPIWDPVDLFKHFDNGFILVAAAICLIAATISVNVAANLVSPIYDLIHAFPNQLNYKKSALLAMLLAFVIMPWKLMESPESVHMLLDTAGAFLGPATGVVLADFWILKKRKISLEDLYKRNGQYHYCKGYNIVAIVATVAGMILSFSGNFIYEPLEGYGWLIGITGGAIIYCALEFVMPGSRYDMDGRQGILNNGDG